MIRLVVGLLLGFVAGVVTMLLVPPSPEPPREWGRFTGDVTATFLPDGRTMRLEQDFAYVDPAGKVWAAPANSVIDGASIPQAFWSIIGGPFEGQFRNASVIHDVACVQKKEPSDDVHRAFYFACRCGGVEETKAKAMYYAVAHFGPQWRIDRNGRAVPINMYAQLSEEDVQKVLRYFEQNNPPIEKIPGLELFSE